MHDSVNKDRARLASENKQSEHSQMGFPLQSCVNERKQGSASQGLHCDTVGRSTSSGVMEGNLQEFGPRSYLRPSVRDGNPRLGYLENSDSTSALTLLYQRMSDNVFRYTYYSEATLPNLTFSPCQLHLVFFLFWSTHSRNLFKIKHVGVALIFDLLSGSR